MLLIPLKPQRKSNFLRSLAGNKRTEVDRLPIGEAKSQAQHGGDSYRPMGNGMGM